MKVLHYVNVPLLSIIQETSETKSFVFEKPENFTYKAGQYIRLILYDKKGKRESRYFTLSSSPLDNQLKITVKIKNSPFRKLLYALKEGALLEFYGPMGMFYIDKHSTGKYIFIAGGVGIAPFMSMFSYAYQKPVRMRATLFSMFPTPDDALFVEDLTYIAHQDDHLKVHFIATKQHGDFKGYKGYHSTMFGRLDIATMTEYVPNLGECSFWICGSNDFIESYKTMLLEAGANIEQIRTELFV